MRLYKFNMLSFAVLVGLWCVIVAEESIKKPVDGMPIIDNGGLNPNLKATDSADSTKLDIAGNFQKALLPGPQIVNEKDSSLDETVPDNTPLAVDVNVKTALLPGPQIVSKEKDLAQDKNVPDNTPLAVDGNVKTALLPGPQIISEGEDSSVDKNVPDNAQLAVDGNLQNVLLPGPQIVKEVKDFAEDKSGLDNAQRAVDSNIQTALLPGPQIDSDLKNSALDEKVPDDAQLDQSINDNVSDNSDKTVGTEVAVDKQAKETVHTPTLEEKTTVLTDQNKEPTGIKSDSVNNTEKVKTKPDELNSDSDNGHVDLDEKANGMMTGNEDWSKVGDDEIVDKSEENLADDGQVSLGDEENGMKTGNKAWYKEGGSNTDEYDSMRKTTDALTTGTSPSNRWADDDSTVTELPDDYVNSNDDDYNYKDDENIWDDSEDDDDNDNDEYDYDEDDDDDDEDEYDYDDDEDDDDDDEDEDEYDYDDEDEDDEDIWDTKKGELELYGDDYDKDGEFDDSSYEEEEQIPEEKDGLWKALDNDPWWKGSGDEADVGLSTTTETWESTTDYEDEDYDYDWGKEKVKDVDAGRNMMESPHHFDNNAGVFAGAKVAGENSPLDGADRSLYSWTLLLSLCLVVALFFIFWNRHKVERYIVSLRRPSINGHSHVRRGDEEKNLLKHEYA